MSLSLHFFSLPSPQYSHWINIENVQFRFQLWHDPAYFKILPLGDGQPILPICNWRGEAQTDRWLTSKSRIICEYELKKHLIMAVKLKVGILISMSQSTETFGRFFTVKNTDEEWAVWYFNVNDLFDKESPMVVRKSISVLRWVQRNWFWSDYKILNNDWKPYGQC